MPKFESKDHPRVCGENALPRALPSPAPGSPPRVRGKQLIYCHSGYNSRITPACAGKTWKQSSNRPLVGDHPRVCGENTPFMQIFACIPGSPPRVRGKHFGNGVFPWLILVLSLNLL